jgi:Ca-activated chloride channel homolog
MIQFMHPEILWALAALPLLALIRGRRGLSAALRYSTLEIAGELGRSRKSRAGKWLAGMRLAVLAAIIIALARPQLVNSSTEIHASGIDIVLALDVSGSMEARDFTMEGKPASRLDVVKSVVARFVQERPNDRIGIVAFAGRPYVGSPLTLDHSWLEKRFETIQTGIVEDGTAIGSAIAACVNRLRDQSAKSRIVILLTDGMNNTGSILPETAAEAAKALGIKVYTIGAGSRGEAPIPVTDEFGNRRMVMARVDIDENTLEKVAQVTGARYFRATDTDSLEKIYGEINRMETTTRTAKKFDHARELLVWPAVAALALLFSEVLLTQTRYRRLP